MVGQRGTLTAAEFVNYWLKVDEEGRSNLSYFEESLGEHEAQYRNECAMFGDAGPGQGYRLNAMRRELFSVRARLEKLGAEAR